MYVALHSAAETSLLATQTFKGSSDMNIDCRYYNPTVASYKGSNIDYNAAYFACETAIEEIDPDLTYGGIAAANQIRHNTDFPLQPTCEDTLWEAAARDAHMDFLSYHSITTTPGMDQIQASLQPDLTKFSRYKL